MLRYLWARRGMAGMAQAAEDPVLQYVVVRKDLTKPPLSWAWGSVISNACHGEEGGKGGGAGTSAGLTPQPAASVAAICGNLGDPVTRDYFEARGGGQMRKVTLQVADEAELRAVAARLEAAGVAHALWTENPEQIVTALATKPYPRSQVQSHLADLKLFR